MKTKNTPSTAQTRAKETGEDKKTPEKNMQEDAEHRKDGLLFQDRVDYFLFSHRRRLISSSTSSCALQVFAWSVTDVLVMLKRENLDQDFFESVVVLEGNTVSGAILDNGYILVCIGRKKEAVKDALETRMETAKKRILQPAWDEIR